MRSLRAAVATLALAGTASAQQSEGTGPRPPPSSAHYLQYGVALTAEPVLSAGDVCPPGAVTPCILESGGGLALRVGYRTRGPWYVGGAYEASRHDASDLLQLAILQQVRAETRLYGNRGNRLIPYATGGLGAVLYGEEWATDTGGVTAFLGSGVEFQISRTTVVGAALTYRVLLLRGWTDESGQRRADRYLGFGTAHLLGVDIVFEARDPLPRW